ncbi:MAG TPA: hypothetical protein VEJ00_07055 [Candidatus Acidoferrales bacterium]|nr:hypothetical protein [Candidatus Acidoferrales bacterium]
MPGWKLAIRLGVALALCALLVAAPARAGELSVDELKAKLGAVSPGDKPHICVQIAQQQLAAADQLYAAVEVEKAQAALTDVVAFSELARDYAIQSHKYQKQTEIAVRAMTRKLNDIMHGLPHDDRPPVHDAIERLQRVRDDLLAAMFPKGTK